MPYDHQKVEQLTVGALVTASNTNLASTGVKARAIPGISPIIVRKVAIQVDVAPGTQAAVVTIRFRPTAGSATGQTTLGTLTIPTAAVPGKVYYLEGLNQKVSPGGEVVADVTTAGTTTGGGNIAFDTEPSWEKPGANNTNMIKVLA